MPQHRIIPGNYLQRLFADRQEPKFNAGEPNNLQPCDDRLSAEAGIEEPKEESRRRADAEAF